MIFSDQLCGVRSVRHSFAGSSVLLALTLFCALANSAQAREPAPVVDATAQTTSELAERLEKIERRLDSQSMMEVLGRLDQLQQEMQNIIGQMEVLNYEMDNIKKRQKDLYVDIDRRITQVEQNAAAMGNTQPSSPTMVGVAPVPSATGAPGTPSTATSPTASGSPTQVAVVSPQTQQLQREAYDRAFNLLKDGRYELAIASFKAYLETYPNADYADNAQYWLGEANYAQRRYDVALQEFNKVLDNFPKSSKRADAMLKMGFSYIELGKTDDAEAVLSNIVTMFPDTTAARLAKKRIQDIKRR